MKVKTLTGPVNGPLKENSPHSRSKLSDLVHEELDATSWLQLKLTDSLHAYVDDQAVMKAKPVNTRATMIVRKYGMPRTVFGTVVFAGVGDAALNPDDAQLLHTLWTESAS